MRNYNKIFEAYQKYSDYKGSWGSPEDLKDDVEISVKHLMPTWEGNWIKSIEDQSTDKGIKFEIKLIKGDVIHAFKTRPQRGYWEFYLNKKKTDDGEIKKYLENKYLTPLEIFRKRVKGYDFTAKYTDYGYSDIDKHNKSIENMFNKLSKSDKKKAQSALLGNPDNLNFKEIIKSVFKV